MRQYLCLFITVFVISYLCHLVVSQPSTEGFQYINTPSYLNSYTTLHLGFPDTIKLAPLLQYQIHITLTNPSSPLIMEPGECIVRFNQLDADTFLSLSDTAFSTHFTTPSLLNNPPYMDLVCRGFRLKSSSNLPGSISFTLNIYVLSEFNPMEEVLSAVNDIVVYPSPTITSQKYQFLDNGAISMKWEIILYGNSNNYRNFAFSHPLVQRNMESLTPSRPPKEMFHTIIPDQGRKLPFILFSGFNGSYDRGSHQVELDGSTQGTNTDGDYFFRCFTSPCEIAVQLDPNTLYGVVNQLNGYVEFPIELRIAVRTIPDINDNSQTFYQAIFDPIAFYIPLQVPLAYGIDRTSIGFIWVAPHHQQLPQQFEFSIAIPTLEWDEAGQTPSDIDPQHLPDTMKLSLYVRDYEMNEPYQEFSTLPSHKYIKKLSTTIIQSIKCTYHHLINNNYVASEYESFDGSIDLTNDIFKNFGATCRVGFATLPVYPSYYLSPQFVFNELSPYGSLSLFTYDQYYYPHLVLPHSLIPSNTKLLGFPVYNPLFSGIFTPTKIIAPVINITNDSANPTSRYIDIKFDYQFLSIDKPLVNDDSNHSITLYFPNLLNIDFVHGSYLYISSMGWVEAPYFVIINGYSRDYSNHFPGTVMDEWDIEPGDSIPYAFMQFPLTLPDVVASLTPYRFHVRIPLKSPQYDTTDEFIVYPVINPHSIASMKLYTPIYTVITPPNPPPLPAHPSSQWLPSYSIRCVPWDTLSAPYIPKDPAFLSTTDHIVTSLITVSDCPMYPSILPPQDDQTYWKKYSYLQRGNDNNNIINAHCFYHLSVVCVSGPYPSDHDDGSQQGEDQPLYRIEPFAYCKPLGYGGIIPSVPCQIAESDSDNYPPIECDNPDDSSCWGYHFTFLDAKEVTHTPSLPLKTRLVEFTYSSNVDPHLSATLSFFLQCPMKDGAYQPDYGIDIIASTAFTFYESISLSDTYTLGLPSFILPISSGDDSADEGDILPIQTRLTYTLNRYPSVTSSIDLEITTQTIQPQDCLGEDGGATNHKAIDRVSHLCICQSGYVSDRAVGMDDPFILPWDFTCTPRQCQRGYTWEQDDGHDGGGSGSGSGGNTNAAPVPDQYRFNTGRCVMDREDDKPLHLQCHTSTELPPVLDAPIYTTRQCKYGFLTSSTDDGNGNGGDDTTDNSNNTCDTCQCFLGWDLTPKTGAIIGDASGKECGHCHLRDVCVEANTEPVTFKTRYCWRNRCICKHGFYGDRCEHRVMYGTLDYRTTASDDDRNRLASTTTNPTPAILPRSRITQFEPRVARNFEISMGMQINAYVQQATQVLVNDGTEVLTTIAIAMTRKQQQQQQQEQTDSQVSSLYTTPMQTLPQQDRYDDIYNAWYQMQTTMGQQPVANDPDFGLIYQPGSAYDPFCQESPLFPSIVCPKDNINLLPPTDTLIDPTEYDDLDYDGFDQYTGGGGDGGNGDGESIDDTNSISTTIYIVIGVVVGVVVIAFIIVIVSVAHCRKHEKACFASGSKRKKRRGGGGGGSQHSTEMTATAGSTTASSAASGTTTTASGTSGTSSFLPVEATTPHDPTLPPDWIVLTDQNTGKVYYSNKVTLESSWDHPAKPKDTQQNEYGW